MSVYAVADLHGVLELYNQIKEFLKPEDIVYCLGDCGDRGPQPWETITTIYNDNQFIYLKGNHEDMLCDAMQDFINGYGFGHNYSLLRSNGGKVTFYDWTCLYNEDSNLGRSWYYNLKDLPIFETYTNKRGQEIFLTHAGFTPPINLAYEYDLLWDRYHFNQKWDEENFLNTVVVHGHTNWYSVMGKLGLYPDIDSPEPRAFTYCNGHKICIDNASFYTGQTVLLNLDTFEVIPFQIPGGDWEE